MECYKVGTWALEGQPVEFHTRRGLGGVSSVHPPRSQIFIIPNATAYPSIASASVIIISNAA